MTDPVRVAILQGTWPVPSESPACLKLMTWLRIAGIPYEAQVLTGSPRSRTGKAPYIIREDGSFLDDSSVIIDTLTQERHVELDSERTREQRALAVLIQRTLESHFYFYSLLLRWKYHWPATRKAYFGKHIPGPILAVVGPMIRRSTLAQAHGQGMGRRPFDEIEAEALADVESVSTILGDDEYFFGSPGVTDAIVYSALENTRSCPIPGKVRDALCADERLVAYLDRIQERYWPPEG